MKDNPYSEEWLLQRELKRQNQRSEAPGRKGSTVAPEPGLTPIAPLFDFDASLKPFVD